MPSKTDLSRHILFWIPVSFVVLILFGLTIVSGRGLFWGLPITQFVPWWVQTVESLRGLELPLWNPNLGMGAPLLANYQLGFVYPPNWLFIAAGFVAGAPGIAWMQAVLIVLHLLWAALGMKRLTQSLGIARFGQIVAALAFTFSGYIIARAWFITITWAVAWLPWLCWAGYRLGVEIQRVYRAGLGWRRDFDRRPLLLLVVCLAMQLLAGHAQISWYTWVLLGIWVLFWGIHGPIRKSDDPAAAAINGGPGNARLVLLVVLILATAVVLAVGLGSLQLLPTAEYLLQSQRATAVDYETALTYSFWPWRLLGFVAPNLFGSPAYGNYWGYANYWEDAVYIGLVPFLLVIGFLSRPTRMPRPYRRMTLLLVIVTLVSFVLAFGKNLPIFPWLYRYIPTFDMFNAPTRWSVLGVFSLALLAGIAAQYWTRPEKRALYWTRLGTAGGFAITAGALTGWLALGQNADAVRLQTMALAIGMAGIWALGGGLLALTAPVRSQVVPTAPSGQYSHWHFIAVLWITLDLTVAGLGLNPSEPVDLYSASPALYPETPAGRVYISASDEYDVKFEKYFQFTTFDSVDDWTLIRETYLPNINILNGGRAAVNNFDPMVPDRFSKWMAALDTADREQSAALLNLSGVSTVVNKDFAAPSGTSLEPVESGGYARGFTCQQYLQDGEAVLAQMLAEPASLESLVYIEGVGSDTITNCELSSNLEINLVQSSSLRKDLVVSFQRETWLMIAESWFPGWQASIDGREVTLFRADYLFQAVLVPAGDHEVRFEYSPVSFKLGVVVSLLTAGLIGLFVLSNRNKNHS